MLRTGKIMSKALKVLFTIFGIIILFFVALVFALYAYVESKNYSPNDPISQAFVFAKHSNKEQCQSKYWDVYKTCSDEPCYDATIQFINVCLMFSRGDKNEFCGNHSNFQEEYINLHKKVNFCGSLGIDQPHCERMYKPLAKFCA